MVCIIIATSILRSISKDKIIYKNLKNFQGYNSKLKTEFIPNQNFNHNPSTFLFRSLVIFYDLLYNIHSLSNIHKYCHNYWPMNKWFWKQIICFQAVPINHSSPCLFTANCLSLYMQCTEVQDIQNLTILELNTRYKINICSEIYKIKISRAHSRWGN